MNRRERRRLEKQMGLMKTYQTSNTEKRNEIRTRRKEMGRMLHQQHLQRIENENRQRAEDTEVKILNDLISSGKSEEEAKQILQQRYADAEERENKREARKQRQLEKLEAKK